jgi:hypothetical protein
MTEPDATPHMRKGIVLTVTGGLMALAAILAAEVPGIFLKVSLTDAQRICESGIGTIGQALNAQVAADCSNVSAGYAAALILGIAGVIVAAVGVIRLARH